MACEFCSRSHEHYINKAWPHSVSADKEKQAQVQISRMLYYTENCAKAIVQGFERFEVFEKDQRTINAVIGGKSVVVVDLKSYPLDTLLSGAMKKIQPLVIENLKKLTT